MQKCASNAHNSTNADQENTEFDRRQYKNFAVSLTSLDCGHDIDLKIYTARKADIQCLFLKLKEEQEENETEIVINKKRNVERNGNLLAS